MLTMNERVVLYPAIDAYGGVCQCCGESQREFLRLWQCIYIPGEIFEWHLVNSSRKYGESLRSLRKADWPSPPDIKLYCNNCGIARVENVGCPHQQSHSV